MSEQIKDFIEAEFEHFHQYPELSFAEFETTSRLKEDLSEHGIEVLPYKLKTGLVAELGSGPKTVALRADLDALPITEATDLPYKSKHPGIMHACGHDSHTAIVLGAALLLKARQAELKGKVRFIFQPAEEAPGGARDIIGAGALNEVEAIFGIHSTPIFEVGTLGISAGPTHAAVEKFSIELTGRGTHAAHPDLGTDVILAASQLVSACQSIVSRNVDPTEPAVLSVTKLAAGNTWNVLPEHAQLEGTVRTYSHKTRLLVKTRLEQLLEHLSLAYEVKASLKWEVELPATNNDETLAELAKRVARRQHFQLEAAPRSLGGEDFSLYQEQLRGLFMLVGTGKSAPSHNPQFKIDKRALFSAANFLAELAQTYLEDTYV